MVRALRASENTVWLTGAYLLQKFVAFGYFVFLTRSVSVGPGGIGRYVFAFALIAIAQVIADLVDASRHDHLAARAEDGAQPLRDARVPSATGERVDENADARTEGLYDGSQPDV